MTTQFYYSSDCQLSLKILTLLNFNERVNECVTKIPIDTISYDEIVAKRLTHVPTIVSAGLEYTGECALQWAKNAIHNQIELESDSDSSYKTYILNVSQSYLHNLHNKSARHEYQNFDPILFELLKVGDVFTLSTNGNEPHVSQLYYEIVEIAKFDTIGDVSYITRSDSIYVLYLNLITNIFDTTYGKITFKQTLKGGKGRL